jgi:hypothetical protein
MLMMMRRPEFLMMRRPEFLMMRRPAPPQKSGSNGTYYTTYIYIYRVSQKKVLLFDS